MDTLERAEAIARLLTNSPGATPLVPFANPVPTLHIKCADDRAAKRLSQELEVAFRDLCVVKDPVDSRVIYLR
jgi:hypothetical protein